MKPAMFDFSDTDLHCLEDLDDDSNRNATDKSDLLPPPETIVSSSDSDDRWISTFLESEIHHMPTRDRSLDVSARLNAVTWILKVHRHYRFRPVTACLSVNYLDRFLSICPLSREDEWPFQLLSVACLSLAAKMEETDVLLLLDFQLFEPRFVFDPRVIRRMEIHVMANLKWRLRAVTPFDFIGCFARKLGDFGSNSNHLFARASYLILSSLTVVDFLDYLPSTIAASAVLRAAGESPDISGRYDENAAILCELLSKGGMGMEMVSRCQELMGGLESDTCQPARPKAKQELAPKSPIAVLDAALCRSCDTQKSGSDNGTSSRAEPDHKRRKL